MNRVVVAAVIERGDSLLLCQRALGKNYGGLWEFPGGKVEDGESMAAAIARELQEELEVEVITVGEAVFEENDEALGMVIRFLAVQIKGTPHPHEHEAVRWVRKDKVLDFPLAPSDRLFAEAVSRSSSRPREAARPEGASSDSS